MKSWHKLSGCLLLGLLPLSLLIPLFRINRQMHQQTLNRALIEAIKKKNIPQAINLLEQGADANTSDKPAPPLTLKSACTDLWRRFFGKKKAKDTNFYPPAMLLIYPQDWRFHYETDRTVVDNADLVQALLEHGADPNVRTRWGDSLLQVAGMKNHSKTVRVLLEHHANPNLRDVDSIMPLMWTSPNDTNCARMLIEYGADVNVRDSRGGTPLMWAWSCKTCQLLLDHGADIDAQDDSGCTTLMRHIEDYNSRLGGNKVRWLLRHGASVNIRDKSGKTALQYAQASHDLPPQARTELISLLEEGAKKERKQQ